ncbi:MAG: hypothetical protein M1530_04230 [Candidatus Marsarchaeota archaeon]|nr:hypothetical protein [Candidatus Marsarchaeota archaeon]
MPTPLMKEPKSTPNANPRLHFHISLGRHYTKKDAYKAMLAFRKHGPFLFCAPEQGMGNVAYADSALLEYNRGLIYSSERMAVAQLRIMQDGRNGSLGRALKAMLIEDKLLLRKAEELELALKPHADGAESGTVLTSIEKGTADFGAHMFAFIEHEPNLLMLPIESREEAARTTMKFGGLNLDSATDEELTAYWRHMTRERDGRIVSNIGRYWEWAQPMAMELAPRLVERANEIKVFVRLGTAHLGVVRRAMETYKGREDIKITYSFDNKRVEKLWKKLDGGENAGGMETNLLLGETLLRLEMGGFFKRMLSRLTLNRAVKKIKAAAEEN